MITIDLEAGCVTVEDGEGTRRFALGSPEGFAIVSQAWLRAGWDAKYVYSFTWLGRPMIQLPEDMVRLQEVIFTVEPDVIIETGVAHGGSLVFYAGLCKAMERGRVIGVDVEIRPHNRAALERHVLRPYFELIEGSSTNAQVIDDVRSRIRPGEKALVVLDSDHSKAHVLAELRAYGPMVARGSYIVTMDGIMGDLVGAPRARDDWAWNNPRAAAEEFAAEDPRFVLEEPSLLFNEGEVRARVTYWPSGFLRRIG